MKEQGCTVYVQNLPQSINDEDLLEIFDVCPDLIRAVVKRDRNGRSLGFGLVHFETPEAAKYAAAMKNGWIIEDNPIYTRLFLRNTGDDSKPYHSLRERHPRVYQPNSYQAIPGVIGYQAHRLTLEALAAATPLQQKQMLAEKLYGPVEHWCTGEKEARSVMQQMMKMDNRALLGLVENAELVRDKVNEAREYFATCQNKPNDAPPSTSSVGAPPANQPTTSANSAPKKFVTLQQMAGATPQEQKKMLAERILPWVEKWQPGNKNNKIITGGLLEMDNFELFSLIQNTEAFRQKVNDLAKIVGDLKD